jgi:hypothetical protein
MLHELKTWPAPFEATWRGEKRFELRLDDRSFELGDELLLREWDPKIAQGLGWPGDAHPAAPLCYTGRQIRARVLYLLRDDWGLPPELVVLSIAVEARCSQTESTAKMKPGDEATGASSVAMMDELAAWAASQGARDAVARVVRAANEDAQAFLRTRDIDLDVLRRPITPFRRTNRQIQICVSIEAETRQTPTDSDAIPPGWTSTASLTPPAHRGEHESAEAVTAVWGPL